MTQQDEKKIGETISQAVGKGQFISTETFENLQFEVIDFQEEYEFSYWFNDEKVQIFSKANQTFYK